MDFTFIKNQTADQKEKMLADILIPKEPIHTKDLTNKAIWEIYPLCMSTNQDKPTYPLLHLDSKPKT